MLRVGEYYDIFGKITDKGFIVIESTRHIDDLNQVMAHYLNVFELFPGKTKPAFSPTLVKQQQTITLNDDIVCIESDNSDVEGDLNLVIS